MQGQRSVHASPPRATLLQSDVAWRTHAPMLAAPMAPSPFALDAQQAFRSPAPGGSRLAPSAALEEGLVPAASEVPIDELLDMVHQQDRLQQSHSGSVEGESQLLALPSNLPPELMQWVIQPADITLLTWANGSLRELGSGAR